MSRKAPRGHKSGDNTSHSESCSSQKPSLQDPSWLRGVWVPRGGSQDRSGVEKETKNWLKINKDPEDLPYINDLIASLLRSSSLRGQSHPFSAGVHLFLASVLTKQTISVCALPLVLCL